MNEETKKILAQDSKKIRDILIAFEVRAGLGTSYVGSSVNLSDYRVGFIMGTLLSMVEELRQSVDK